MALIITPLLVNLSLKEDDTFRQVNLYLSSSWEELFGKELTVNILQEFNEQNPDILVRVLTADGEIPRENSREVPRTEAGVPDILIFDDSNFSALIAAGSLKELNSFLTYEVDTVDTVNVGEPDEHYIDETILSAFPLVSFMYLLFYNIDILSAAGFDHPPKTREEFLSYARTVSRGGFNASGTALSLSTEDRQAVSRDIFSWIWAGGGNFWTSADRPVINTRAIVNDFSFLGTLSRDNLLAPGIFETTGEQRLEEFAMGQVAMMIASAQVIPYLRERMGDSAFGVTTIPNAGMGGRYSTGLSSIYAGINADSAYPDEAWRFLVFLSDKSLLFCAELNAVPGLVANIIPGNYVIVDPFYSKAWDIFEASQIAEGFSGNPAAHEYENAFLEELRIFFETRRTAQQTVTAIQQRWDSISEDN